MASVDENIAAGLRMHRALKKASQKAVAEAIGTNQSTISSWENSGGIGFAEAWAAADYYNCSLDELAGRIWPPKEC